MLSVAKLRREHTDAGSLNELVALWGFVDDSGTFLTKAGHLGVVYEVAGVDYEGLTHSERQTLAHNVEAGLRLLDEHFRVYQYLLKRTADRIKPNDTIGGVAGEAINRRTEDFNRRRHELFVMSQYLVLVYEPPAEPLTSTRLENLWASPAHAIQGWLSTTRATSIVATTLDRAIAQLHYQAHAFEVQLGEFGLCRLQNRGAFAFFRSLLNYDPEIAEAVPSNPDSHLDYLVGDSAIECHRDHLLVGRHAVRLLSMKEPPTHTFAHIIADLQNVCGEFIACLEWRRLGSDRVRRDLHARRRHFFNKRVSLVNYVSTETRGEDMLVDDSAAAMVRQLGDALTEIEVNGHFFGECSLTVEIFGSTRSALDRQVADTLKALATHDGQFFEESYNPLNAWLSVVPGNSHHNLRRLALLETNAADLSFVFTLDNGSADPHREPLAILDTAHNTTFGFDLHVDDVGHTLVLGATGSGKSFLLNFVITHAQKHAPLTVVFDLGHSFRKLASLLDGQYVELAVRNAGVSINPFAFDPTPQHLNFLHAFVRVVLESTDQYRLSELEDRELYDAVVNVYALDRTERRLRTVAHLLPRALAARLQKWVDGGRYASVFDNEHDTVTVAPLQVFDFDGMRDYAVVLEPLLFYLLHRVTDRIQNAEDPGRLKLCVMDEAWRFIQHPSLHGYVREALKTWRKHNAAMILATQAAEDFADTELLRTVVESCPTKLFLANPALDRQVYADLFQLNQAELDLLANLIPRQQLLLKRHRLAKVLNLRVDPKSYWIYTNTPDDNVRYAAATRDHGLEPGLDALIASA